MNVLGSSGRYRASAQSKSGAVGGEEKHLAEPRVKVHYATRAWDGD
jgi:hypothetical protein